MNSVLALSYCSDGRPAKQSREAENKKCPVANCHHVDVRDVNHLNWIFNNGVCRNPSGSVEAFSWKMDHSVCFCGGEGVLSLGNLI